MGRMGGAQRSSRCQSAAPPLGRARGVRARYRTPAGRAQQAKRQAGAQLRVLGLAFRSVRYSFWSRFMHCLLVAMLCHLRHQAARRCPQREPIEARALEATKPGAGGRGGRSICGWF
jgi:hypothetical protein